MAVAADSKSIPFPSTEGAVTVTGAILSGNKEVTYEPAQTLGTNVKAR